jgi:hypothetical protein
MAIPAQTQPSPVRSDPAPIGHPNADDQVGDRIGKDVMHYQGPSRRNYSGRVRMMMALLGAIVAVCIIAVVRVLTHGGL